MHQRAEASAAASLSFSFDYELRAYYTLGHLHYAQSSIEIAIYTILNAESIQSSCAMQVPSDK